MSHYYSREGKCTIINIQAGVIALLGDNSLCNCQLKNLEHIIDLYIQYGNQPICPIQIQIDTTNWKKHPNDIYFIRLLYKQEDTAKFYNVNKEQIRSSDLY